jgi:glycosyltransferase involved in cell wall biosynthesis
MGFITMPVRQIAVLGNHTPRQCGIAAFTEDLAQALADRSPDVDVVVAAMNDGRSYAYPARVRLTIEQDDLDAYEAAADDLNAGGIDVLNVQHEFGIFGGPAGSYLLTLLRRIRAPIVTTLHTVLERFTPEQLAVVEELALLSARIVVMSERAVRFLVNQGVPREKVAFIHHGVHVTDADRNTEKARLGLPGRTLILTFGLLSPNKGIETAVRALPGLVQEFPDVTYLVLGATHPNVRAHQGEAYREELVKLAADLGVAAHVRFDDTFVDRDELTRCLAAADIYLIPYPKQEQITSGTLAYAVGNGKAVVSTPFWHAEELLADGRGVLVPFHEPMAFGTALRRLLGKPHRRAAMERRALAFGEQMRWPEVARAYAGLFDATRQTRPRLPPSIRLPALTLDHVAAMVDGTGMFQHAVMAVPNLSEGYTTDDNARALHLAVLADHDPHAPAIVRRTLSFLHHALNPASGRFRNFMAYDRRWLDEHGGENAQARAVRALVAAAHRLDGALGRTARELLRRSWPALEGLSHPRAQALALIALAERAENEVPDPAWTALADRYAGSLLLLYGETATQVWQWFENDLSYSNAKLPHGLIAYGRVFGHPQAVATGLAALRWLESQQTAPNGGFQPIGSDRRYHAGEARPLWDGQPIEVYATVSADLEAHRATGDAAWLAGARRALEWLLGRNTNGASLHDMETQGCRDGLERVSMNENQGAESTLALWLSAAEYSRAAQLSVPRGPGRPAMMQSGSRCSIGRRS